VDAAYTYIHAGENDVVAAVDGGPVSNGPFSGEGDSHVHLISLGGKIRFGGPAPAK
jgi:hypothetical protein